MRTKRKPFRFAEHQPEFMECLHRKGLEVPVELLGPLLRAIDRTKQAWRSEAATQAIRDRQCRGLRYTRHAGYGFKWVGRRGHQRRVPDEGEQRVMRHIVTWWEEGFSWYEIARHLLLNRVKTADGHEWSEPRVRRAYHAARNAVKLAQSGINAQRPPQAYLPPAPSRTDTLAV